MSARYRLDSGANGCMRVQCWPDGGAFGVTRTWGSVDNGAVGVIVLLGGIRWCQRFLCGVPV